MYALACNFSVLICAFYVDFNYLLDEFYTRIFTVDNF